MPLPHVALHFPSETRPIQTFETNILNRMQSRIEDGDFKDGFCPSREVRGHVDYDMEGSRHITLDRTPAPHISEEIEIVFSNRANAGVLARKTVTVRNNGQEAPIMTFFETGNSRNTMSFLEVIGHMRRAHKAQHPTAKHD